MSHQYMHPVVAPPPAHPDVPAPEPPAAITALERLEHTSDAVLAAIAELSDYLTGVTRPAERRTVRFIAGQTRVWDQDARVAPSVGFYNPNAFSVFAALGGEIPDGTMTGAFEVTGNSFIVVPVGVQDLELGVRAADLGGNSALVHVFRFWTVQPAFFGAWK
jgi:hypothetical protein